KITKEDLQLILKEGAEWAVKKGFGKKEDLEKTEDGGKMTFADPSAVSERALQRGFSQLGSLGSGNHFLEIQYISKIYNPEVAKTFGLLEEGQVVVMFHCGSRGLGHQVASDYIREMEDTFGWKHLPDRELVNAPLSSDLGKKYLGAMAAAANFAFCNRQMIMEWIKQTFVKVFGDKVTLEMVYDITHNMAKVEEYTLDGKKVKLCVHRKGATRAFGPGRKELPEIYRSVGQPILLPGSMGTSSYVLVGTKKAEELTFGSTAHGAGRLMSRHEAIRTWSADDVKKDLAKKEIYVKAGSWSGISEEAPGAYKNVDEVVAVSDAAGIGKMVCQLKPMGVVKG
ncbi:MAG TPA: RtcB family protein, partial [Nanoarchaeota archaeon]|nr:RtcB family protein [Nanoarchaeota archaeon]HIJ04892.1 RtcB family protein [Nanoarchaeota archaeon]